MAIKKAKSDKNIQDKSSIKVKTLFDHVNAITEVQDPNYFDKLSEADKKSWSTFMINRFLSMNENWTETIAELDPLTTAVQLRPELVYKTYIDIFPKGRVYLKYIKSSKETKYNDKLIKFLKKHFELSAKECIDYLDTILLKPDGINEIKKLLYFYGTDSKDVDKLLKF